MALAHLFSPPPTARSRPVLALAFLPLVLMRIATRAAVCLAAGSRVAFCSMAACCMSPVSFFSHFLRR